MCWKASKDELDRKKRKRGEREKKLSAGHGQSANSHLQRNDWYDECWDHRAPGQHARSLTILSFACKMQSTASLVFRYLMPQIEGTSGKKRPPDRCVIFLQ